MIETPPGLLPNHPSKRPADISITLSYSPAIPLPASFNHITIDVTITIKAPQNTPGLPAPEIPAVLSKAHHTSMSTKFTGTNPNLFIAKINAQGIFLLPFTIDHLGGILATISTASFTP
jgi:hypothetical protein